MTAFALCLLYVCALKAQAQTPTPTPTPSSMPSSTQDCSKVAPQSIRLLVAWPKGGAPVARKRFYLSPYPFNLEKIPNLGRPPTRRSYYEQLASKQGKDYGKLIQWLEANNCDTVYCRPLEEKEVTCAPSADKTNPCVPEFVQAYNQALAELKDKDRARKWVTNYAPLSAPELRDGFYTEKTRWLDATMATIEAANKKAADPPSCATKDQEIIKSAFTDKTGTAYFQNLYPGTAYYISNIAPIEIEGKEIIWETTATKIGDDAKTPVRKDVYLSDKNGQKITLPSNH